jgi:hypothetical protein
MGKERPILKVTDQKIRKNTGTVERPFWTSTDNTRWVRLFGLLIFKHISTGDFPDSKK